MMGFFQWLSGRRQGQSSEPQEGSGDHETLPEMRDSADVSADVESTPLYKQLHHDWLFSNWENLAQIDESTLRSEPQRGELAVWLGAAHLQQGQQAQAERFFSLAREWRISEQYLARVLMAMAQQTLGVAHVAHGHPEKALAAYQEALSLGGSCGFLLREIEGLRKTHGIENLEKKDGLGVQPINTQKACNLTQALERTMEGFSDGILTEVAAQNEGLKKVRDFVLREIKKDTFNASKQTQSFIAVQNYFLTDELPAVSTELNMWAISPDFSLFLIRLLELERYDIVLEFGSGYSTELIARVLQRIRQRGKGYPSVTQVAFEHLEGFHKKTLQQLQLSGLLSNVKLVLAPLELWRDDNGKEFSYYHPETVLKTLKKINAEPRARVLVLVDGPPGVTGPLARYPALPIVSSIFPRHEVHYLMDDYIREDEKKIVNMWRKNLTNLGKNFTVHETKLEKDACIVRVL